VEIMQPERDAAATQLFQILFVMQNGLVPVAQTETLSLHLTGVETNSAKFDLALFCQESVREEGRQIYVQWVYSTDLFDGIRIRQMAERFETVVSALVARPDIRLADLKQEVLAADRARRRNEQERRDAANHSRFQRARPLPQKTGKASSEDRS
jgi:non-ribosomal peptide synthetase component F